MNWIFLIISFLTLFAIYFFAENRLLLIKSYRLKKGENGYKLKIVQISDIHKKRCAGKICSKVRMLEPDIAVLTGDIVSRHENDFLHLERLTKELAKICPVFACPGNHELDLSAEKYNEYKNIMKKNNICWLENKQAYFEKNGKIFRIAGASLKRHMYRNEKGGFSGLESITAEELENVMGKKEGFTILLAHNPFGFETYKKWGADVVFCGHVHGGSVRLPFLGGLLSPERKFFPKYSKGIYKLGNTDMLVSVGIGKPRVFNPPEIVYCELEY